MSLTASACVELAAFSVVTTSTARRCRRVASPSADRSRADRDWRRPRRRRSARCAEKQRGRGRLDRDGEVVHQQSAGDALCAARDERNAHRLGSGWDHQLLIAFHERRPPRLPAQPALCPLTTKCRSPTTAAAALKNSTVTRMSPPVMSNNSNHCRLSSRPSLAWHGSG